MGSSQTHIWQPSCKLFKSMLLVLWMHSDSKLAAPKMNRAGVHPETVLVALLARPFSLLAGSLVGLYGRVGIEKKSVGVCVAACV